MDAVIDRIIRSDAFAGLYQERYLHELENDENEALVTAWLSNVIDVDENNSDKNDDSENLRTKLELDRIGTEIDNSLDKIEELKAVLLGL